jgi:hypothetical protein
VELDGKDQETNDEELLNANACHVYVDTLHSFFVGLARACAHTTDDLNDEGAEVKEDKDCCKERGFEYPDLTLWYEEVDHPS